MLDLGTDFWRSTAVVAIATPSSLVTLPLTFERLQIIECLGKLGSFSPAEVNWAYHRSASVQDRGGYAIAQFRFKCHS